MKARYSVSYNNKTYIVCAEDAVEAIERLAERPRFGGVLIPWRICTSMIDADTRGLEWAEAYTLPDTDGSGARRRIFAQRAKEDKGNK